MARQGWITVLTVLVLAVLTAASASAQTALLSPDLRGTWKGETEAIIMGNAGSHHPPVQVPEPQLTSVALTLTIDRQEGRRFAGTLASARSREVILGVVSRTGTLFMADDDGYDFATLLGEDRMELCNLHADTSGRVAFCVQLVRQDP
jgi:hypothetical protein